MKRTLIALLCATCLLHASAHAATRLVKADGTGDYPTIQAAIDASAPLDTVLLDTGVFTGAGNKNLDTQGKAIVITSLAGPDNTIIDCQDDGRGIFIGNGEGSGTVIAGIQFRYGSETEGGAMRIIGASPTITGNIFYANRADSGGAVCIDSSQSVFARNVFDANVGNPPWVSQQGSRTESPDAAPLYFSAPSGGAMFIRGGTLSIVSNLFSNHRDYAYRDAPCVYARGATLSVVANEFINNGYRAGPNGSALGVEDCVVDIAANQFRRSGSWEACLNLLRSTGAIRANQFTDNTANLASTIEVLESEVLIAFNYMARNLSRGTVVTDGSRATFTRNIVRDALGSTFPYGLGVHVDGGARASITQNLFYHNDPAYGPHDGYDLAFSFGDPLSPEPTANMFDSPSPGCPVGHILYAASGPTATPPDSIHSAFNGSWERGPYDFCSFRGSVYLIQMDPDFQDPEADNFFLGESTQAVDPWFFDIQMLGIVGPLPPAAGPADVVDAVPPPDDTVDGNGTGTHYVLSGFQLTNTSPLDACITYRLIIEGFGTLHDNGDATSLVGATPVLAPGESYSPPEAAVVAPPGNGVAFVHYVYAYAPALLVTDTVTTRVDFGAPVAVGLQSLTGLATAGTVTLSWETADALSPDGWRVYRSSRGSPVLLTQTTLDASARSYVDISVELGRDYTYALASVEGNGENVLGRVSVRTATPELALLQNTPNPFNPATTIRFSLDRAQRALLAVYSIDGKRIATLVDAPLGAGVHAIPWDGTDDNGSRVASGVYLYRLRAGSRSLVRKMVLLK